MPKRNLEHDALYDGQIAQIGDIQRMDEVLRGVHGAIAFNADEFPLVPGTNTLRIAKTKHFAWDGGIIPHLVVWFSIKDENTVRLRCVDVEILAQNPDEDDLDEY